MILKHTQYGKWLDAAGWRAPHETLCSSLRESFQKVKGWTEGRGGEGREEEGRAGRGGQGRETQSERLPGLRATCLEGWALSMGFGPGGWPGQKGMWGGPLPPSWNGQCAWGAEAPVETQPRSSETSNGPGPHLPPVPDQGRERHSALHLVGR